MSTGRTVTTAARARAERASDSPGWTPRKTCRAARHLRTARKPAGRTIENTWTRASCFAGCTSGSDPHRLFGDPYALLRDQCIEEGLRGVGLDLGEARGQRVLGQFAVAPSQLLACGALATQLQKLAELHRGRARFAPRVFLLKAQGGVWQSPGLPDAAGTGLDLQLGGPQLRVLAQRGLYGPSFGARARAPKS